jgi:hypothetical protein
LTSDQARIDEERLIVLAISDLEPPHVKTLAIVSRSRRPLTRESIEGNVGLSDADIVIPVLLRHGLVRVPHIDGLTVGDPPQVGRSPASVDECSRRSEAILAAWSFSSAVNNWLPFARLRPRTARQRRPQVAPPKPAP